MLGLQPGDVFAPQRLWQLPLTGLHQLRAARDDGRAAGRAERAGALLAAAPIEVIAFATDVSGCDETSYELAYSSHETPPETMAQAVLASAAISALVLPLPRRRPDRDRRRLGAELPARRTRSSGRASSSSSRSGTSRTTRASASSRSSGCGRRLQRFRAVPPVRALIAQLDEAEARAGRGEPVHFGDMIVRLTRVAIQRNTALEERLAAEHAAACRELEALRADVVRLAREHARPGRRARAARAVEERFAQTRLPRTVPQLVVRASAGADSLEHGLRESPLWPEESKRALIARGWEAADAELRAYDSGRLERAS